MQSKILFLKTNFYNILASIASSFIVSCVDDHFRKSGLVVAAPQSGQGKTLITIALLHHLSKKMKVSPFKTGPDFIDPQFHHAVCGSPSVNLDIRMMERSMVKYTYQKYALDSDLAVVEGVMGVYDGLERQASTFEAAELLSLPIVLVVNVKGSQESVLPLLYGFLNFKNGSRLIRAVIFNRVGSESHYRTLKSLVQKEFPKLTVAGWVASLDISFPSRHLGLDLNFIEHLKESSLLDEVCRHIDIEALLSVASSSQAQPIEDDPFPIPENALTFKNKKCAVVYDRAFSFLYHDNLTFLKELFGETLLYRATDNHALLSDVDFVYIPGGYVETEDNYRLLASADHFLNSLRNIANNHHAIIYGECAGLLYLSSSLTLQNHKQLPMSSLLALRFSFDHSFQRLGYYQAKRSFPVERRLTGHSFHYSRYEGGDVSVLDLLWKDDESSALAGGWYHQNIYGTYLHTFFRNQPWIITDLFLKKY